MQYAMSATPSSYYQKQDQLGAQGDFTTAPEISQLFGETLALWVIDKWYQMKGPSRTNLVELGPGHGTLMRDLLNVAKLVPAFYQSLEVELIEINPHFAEKQQVALKQFSNRKAVKHLARVEDIAKIPSIIIANEFFDSLPINQYIKSKEVWYEVVVCLDSTYEQLKFDKLLITPRLQANLLKTYPNAVDSAIVEESTQSQDIIKFISEHIKLYGGASLIIDYGYDVKPALRTSDQYHSTLQAIMNHQYCGVLENLGRADLSAHVDFNKLKTIAKDIGINALGTIAQGDFLISNGILLRSQLLQNRLTNNEVNIISRQVDRLIAANKMGLLFKALSLFYG
ncbi:unnamed protein product [Rotaria sp. Silwood2]|nr:unnamed protein product [Rotaria sp. Silwood2]CAF4601907.1 unnamed protein product [Rotaria sp. Silwood2]